MAAFSHRPGAVNYPCMERQDLTQGQLGSFKFTPTDEVSPRYVSHTPYLATLHSAQPIVNHQRITEDYLHSIGDIHPSHSVPADNIHFHDSGNPTHTYVGQYAGRGSGLSTQPVESNYLHHKGDSHFFETHMKNDLVNARLRLSPSVVRAAVDGSSPTSKRTLRDWEYPQSTLTPPVPDLLVR